MASHDMRLKVGGMCRVLTSERLRARALALVDLKNQMMQWFRYEDNGIA
jgi:hypothetical protein